MDKNRIIYINNQLKIIKDNLLKMNLNETIDEEKALIYVYRRIDESYIITKLLTNQ